MSDRGFGYLAILTRDLTRATSLAAFIQSASEPFRGVIWNVQSKSWTFNDDALARFLYDDRYEDRGKVIDRAAAEDLARRELGSEVPAEEELRRVCDAG